MSTFLCRRFCVDCSMSTALCRLLYVDCSMSTALCRLLYVDCSMSTALCQLLYVERTMLYVERTMLYVDCTMLYVDCTMLYVNCFVPRPTGPPYTRGGWNNGKLQTFIACFRPINRIDKVQNYYIIVSLRKTKWTFSFKGARNAISVNYT